MESGCYQVMCCNFPVTLHISLWLGLCLSGVYLYRVISRRHLRRLARDRRRMIPLHKSSPEKKNLAPLHHGIDLPSLPLSGCYSSRFSSVAIVFGLQVPLNPVSSVRSRGPPSTRLTLTSVTEKKKRGLNR